MEKKKIICRARSKRNGIVFYSNTFPLIGSETFRDDAGKLHSQIIPVSFDKQEQVKQMKDDGEITRIREILAFDSILVTLCLLSRDFWFVFAAIHFSIFVSFDFLRFVKFAYQMKSKKGKERSTAKFHAAEHMVINAYEKLQRIPTFDEVKVSSRFSKNCGSKEILYRISNYMLISLIIAFVTRWNGFYYFWLAIIISISMGIAYSKGWLRFLQVFITTPPSDSEIELAIEGIKEFEKMEEKLNHEGEISKEIPFPYDTPFLF